MKPYDSSFTWKWSDSKQVWAFNGKTVDNSVPFLLFEVFHGNVTSITLLFNTEKYLQKYQSSQFTVKRNR